MAYHKTHAYDVHWTAGDNLSGLRFVKIEEKAYCLWEDLPIVGPPSGIPIVGPVIGPVIGSAPLPKCSAPPVKGGPGDGWTVVCSQFYAVSPPAAAVLSDSGDCHRDPTELATYCYRIRVQDQAGNEFLTDGNDSDDCITAT